MTGVLRVLAPGLMTTVQDRGRTGYQAFGIPVSGALDAENLVLANALAGNDPATAALEIRLVGPTMKVDSESVVLALSGTAGCIEILEPERRSVASHRSVTLVRGQVFRIAEVSDTACCYLAVGGGIDVPAVYRSRSTYLPGGFGGFNGRALLEGDALRLLHERMEKAPERVMTRMLPGSDSRRIRVVSGPQADDFTVAGRERFFSGPYRVTHKVNRMGVWLEGPTLEHKRGFDIPSDGIVRGAIQVPGDGQPVVLLSDCQTTGGYPKIATVISADLPAVGRILPDADIRFCEVDVQTAEAAARKAREALSETVKAIRTNSADERELERLLLTSNLISGVVGEDHASELQSGMHAANRK